jgi:transposase-like protein
MSAERRRFTAAEKLAILREHLILKLALSEVCQKHDISPTLFYLPGHRARSGTD